MLAELEAGNVLSILFWVVVTIAALIGGYVVVMRLREWLRGPDVTSAPIGFTLSDLRKLENDGTPGKKGPERRPAAELSGREQGMSFIRTLPAREMGVSSFPNRQFAR
jgi:hypothetical protein